MGVNNAGDAVNRIRHPKKRAFLAALAEVGNISRAAQIAKVDRSTHYAWLASDEDGAYAAAVADAEQQAADHLETEARRRAVDGWDEPLVSAGKNMGVVRRYSDTLLIFLMKGARPEKYKDRMHTELTGNGGGPIEIESGPAVVFYLPQQDPEPLQLTAGASTPLPVIVEGEYAAVVMPAQDADEEPD